MSSGNWCICRSISVLQRQRDRDEALVTLTRAARQVEPIMKKRGWVVHQLSEFLPRSQGLLGLNVNRGQQVKVRMRRSAGGGFFHYEQILKTLLHELCHNRHGAHSVDFYKLLDEITDECEVLMRKSIMGDGKGGQVGGAFDGRSSGAVGGRPAGRSVSRKDAARAAEKRAKSQTIMPQGGRRLGADGTAGTAAADPRAAAAEAARRRSEEDVWCPGDNKVVIDLVSDDEGDDDDVVLVSARPGGGAATSGASAAARGGNAARAKALRKRKAQSDEPIVIGDTSSDEEEEEEKGARPIGGGGGGGGGLRRAHCPVTAAHWQCRACTLSNAPKESHCTMCRTWRYASILPTPSADAEALGIARS